MNKNHLRRLGIGAGIVGLLVFLLTGFVCARSSSLLDARLETDVVTPLPAADLARGEHLVRDVLACTSCHGDDLGGGIVSEDGAMGRVVASNLTRGSGGGALTAAQWEHAIRFGLGRDGRPLVIMPSDQYTAMSAEDLASVIAYLDTVPPVDRELAPTALGPVGRALVAKDRQHFLWRTFATGVNNRWISLNNDVTRNWHRK
ncbi:MAG: cytochrome c, partial [Deltaproteobacteria bacterium]|nr:cytochrome c [Deltaproteobacteria bacterium]